MFCGILGDLAGSRRRDPGGPFYGFCIFDRDRLQSSRGQLQRVSLPGRIVAPPNVRARLGFDLLSQSRGDQLRCDLLGSGALQTRRSNNAAVFALRGGAEHDELRVGEFDGHGLTPRLWEHGQSGPSPGRAPDRCDRRGEGVSAGHTRPAESTYTLSFEGNASLFVRTGAVIWKRDNQAVPTTPSTSALQRMARSSTLPATVRRQPSSATPLAGVSSSTKPTAG